MSEQIALFGNTKRLSVQSGAGSERGAALWGVTLGFGGATTMRRWRDLVDLSQISELSSGDRFGRTAVVLSWPHQREKMLLALWRDHGLY